MSHDVRPWVTRFQERPVYEPGGHAHVVNRSLAGIDVRASDRLSIWHGTMQPGGDAQPHVHADSDQVYVVVSGRVRVACGADTAEIGTLDAAYIPAGSKHSIVNIGDEPAQVLVISSPGLPGDAAGLEGGNGWAS